MIVQAIHRGTSLLEILVVITLLSLLIITSYFTLPPQINKAFDTRRKIDLHQIKTNLEIYYSLAEQFPESLPDCGQPLTYRNQIILASIPCDPVTKEPYYYQVKGNSPQSYRLYTLLSNTKDISISDVGCPGGCGPDCSFNYGVSSTNVGLVRCSYVCAPGGGRSGSCELYQNPSISLCPKLYNLDPTCNNECNKTTNRCQNASGKNIPN